MAAPVDSLAAPAQAPAHGGSRRPANSTQASTSGVHGTAVHRRDELDGLGDALEQAEQRTERMQARASALDRLVDAGVLDMPVEAGGDWPSLSSTGDQASEVVEERLAALKRRAVLCD